TDPLQYSYTVTMTVFVSLGVLALIFGLWLKSVDHKEGYGLELPNIASSEAEESEALAAEE
ncbi:MAG: hypothetical protein PUC94_04510, partial [Bacteroidales bacterium]|nr:hypothetical protein [Bacteroidales bacterium]